MFHDVTGIKRERQRDEYMEAHHNEINEEQANVRMLGRRRHETGQPGIEGPGKHQGHDAQIPEVERHVGQREGERYPAVAMRFRLLGRRELGRDIGRLVGDVSCRLSGDVRSICQRRLQRRA